MYKKILTLALSAALLLSGCTWVGQNLDEVLAALETTQPAATTPTTSGGETTDVPADDASPGGLARLQAQYTRPDLDEYLALAEEAYTLGETGSSLSAVVRKVNQLYDAYDEFYTMLYLADISYSMDLSDTSWQAEYDFCMSASTQVDESIELLYASLAQSPILDELEGQLFGDGFFDGYDQPGSAWPEEFTRLLEEEAQLLTEYYDQSDVMAGLDPYAPDYFDQAAQTLGPVMLDLISVRQEMADLWGYESYEAFAWDFYYYRDYTTEQVDSYLEDIRQYLVPVYTQLWGQDDIYDIFDGSYDASQCLAYVSSAAENMGGIIEDAYALMAGDGLYDLSASPNKYPGSFEVYLISFDVPFVFLNPGGDITDLTAFAHEFGHFANDYAAEGAYLSADVAEIMSQAMEYLSLDYATAPDEDTLALVRQAKLADSLSTYVEQAAYYSFEREMYAMDNPTLEDLNAAYAEVAQAFGFDTVGWAPGEWATVPHFFTQPFYILSYVVSNDAAMQIYQMEQEEAGSGLALYTDMLYLWESTSPLTFLEEQGLGSPFASGRVEALAGYFQAALC